MFFQLILFSISFNACAVFEPNSVKSGSPTIVRAVVKTPLIIEDTASITNCTSRVLNNSVKAFLILSPKAIQSNSFAKPSTNSKIPLILSPSSLAISIKFIDLIAPLRKLAILFPNFFHFIFLMSVYRKSIAVIKPLPSVVPSKNQSISSIAPLMKSAILLAIFLAFCLMLFQSILDNTEFNFFDSIFATAP